MPPRTRDDESENGVDPPRHVHYHQTKNGGSERANTILLAALLAIVGFMGIQVWLMNGRMSAFEATLNLLVQRSGIAAPQQ